MKIKVGDFLTAKKDLFNESSLGSFKEITKGEKVKITEISKDNQIIYIKNGLEEICAVRMKNLNEYFEGWVNKPNLEVFEKHKELFHHMDNEHGVILLESELQEITGIVAKELGFDELQKQNGELLEMLSKVMHSSANFGYSNRKAYELIKKHKPIEVFRKCPNCGNNNTKEESCNKYVCKYCEGEIDTEF